jgi:hypothetical protein
MSGNEENSIKEAGGCAAGFRGKFFNFNADAEARLADALLAVGKYVQGESGCLLGHIKAAVVNEKGEGITLNLIDMDNGVEHHGTLPRSDVVTFDFMCAVLDVDEHELTHKMLHAIDDSGIDYFIDKESLEHHHHHDHGECDDPDCDCHKHKHEDGEECDDPDCECHKHHHHHHDGEECDDPDCDCHKHSFADMIDENGHFSHEHHHHDHEHEHHHDGECHCHDHDHDHDEECHDHEHEHHEKECHCHDEEEKPKKKGLFGFLKKH